MYWIVLFLTHVRLINNRGVKNDLFRMALYHLWDLNRQIGGEVAVPDMLQPLKALVCMWGVMLHTEYQMFRATWAQERGGIYDPHSCGCALCKAPTRLLFPATRYWEVLRRVGIPTCLCEVCLARPQPAPQPFSAAAPAAAPASISAAPAAAVASHSAAPAVASASSSAHPPAAAPGAPPHALFRPPGMPQLIPMGHGRPINRPAAHPVMPRPMVGIPANYAAIRSPDGLRVTIRRIKEQEE